MVHSLETVVVGVGSTACNQCRAMLQPLHIGVWITRAASRLSLWYTRCSHTYGNFVLSQKQAAEFPLVRRPIYSSPTRANSLGGTAPEQTKFPSSQFQAPGAHAKATQRHIPSLAHLPPQEAARPACQCNLNIYRNRKRNRQSSNTAPRLAHAAVLAPGRAAGSIGAAVGEAGAAVLVDEDGLMVEGGGGHCDGW
jgi:hypothetical protein